MKGRVKLNTKEQRKYLRQKHREHRKKEQKKKHESEIHQGYNNVLDSKPLPTKSSQKNTIYKQAKNIISKSKAELRQNKMLNICLALYRLCSLILGGSLMLMEIEKFLDNVYYHVTIPNYHENINVFSFWFGFLLFFAALIISRTYTQTSIYYDDKNKAVRYLKQFSNTLVALSFFQYLVEFLLFCIFVLALFLTNLYVDAFGKLWPILQTTWIIIYLVLAFIFWTYLSLLQGVAISKTLSAKQAIKKSFKIYKHNFKLIMYLTVRFLPLTLGELLTIGFLSIYGYPLKLAVINNIIKESE